MSISSSIQKQKKPTLQQFMQEERSRFDCMKLNLAAEETNMFASLDAVQVTSETVEFCQCMDDLEVAKLIRGSITSGKDEAISVSSSGNKEMRTRTVLFELLKAQESQFQNVKDAMENLERKLTLIELDKTKLEELVQRYRFDAGPNIQLENDFIKLAEEDLSRQFSSIYVSPVFEDRKSYRLRTGQDKTGQCQPASNENLDQKDMQIEELKKEIWSLRNEIQSGKKTSILLEKDMSNKKPNPSVGNGLMINSHIAPPSGLAELDRQSPDCHFPQPPTGKFAPNGFMKVMKEKLADARRENAGPFFMDAQNHEAKRLERVHGEVFMLSRVPNANNTSEPKKTEVVNTCCLGLPEDKLRRLVALCKEWEEAISRYKRPKSEKENFDLQSLTDLCLVFLSQMAGSLNEFEKEICVQVSYANEISESMLSKEEVNAISESKNFKMHLETLEKRLEEEIGKNKSLSQSLGNQEKKLASIIEEHQVELERKEKTLMYAQQLNLELTNEMSKTETSLADLRSHYKGEVASLQSQLNDANRDLEGVQVAADQLAQQLADSELRILDLERALAEKDEAVEELKRRMLAFQNETDATVLEKLELVVKTQDIRKDCDETKARLTELVSINEELLSFAQAKEEQLASLNQEASRLLGMVSASTEENTKLKQQLESTQEDLRILREDSEKFKQEYTLMKSKLYEAEHELSQREAALERLANYLASCGDGGTLAFAETKELSAPLMSGGKSNGQLKQSQIIVAELEEKLILMETEVLRTSRDMASLKEEKSNSTEERQQGGALGHHRLQRKGMLGVSFPMEVQATY